MPKSANTADEYDFVDHHDTALDPEVVAQLREWLHPTDYLAESGEFRRHLLSQAPGTGLWICQTEEYRKWHDSPDHGSLWIKGAPGAGKSIMLASLIQHLRVTENCPVLFFFFRNIVAANFSPRALIQDWLAQLLPYSPKLQFALQFRRLTSSLEETSDSDLIQLFLDGVSCVPKLYCVGDALDEMSTDNKPFLEKLNSLATHRPRTLKLLMTSRPKQYLQSTLRDSSIVHVSLQQRLVDVDILAYLNHRFDILQKPISQRQLKQDVIDMVAQKSEGLFLYAKLTMDQLEESLQSDTIVDIAALETSLPIGLEQTYTRMLAKQRCESEVTTYVQLTVLEAITHASRPLRLNELAGLLECVYPSLAQPNTFKALIASSCGPLIEILEDETLQVIHHSFTEFLRGENRNALTAEASSFPVIDSLQAHRHMAINCLQYLQAGSMLLDIEKSGTVPLDPTITFTSPRDTFDLYESSRRVPHWRNIKRSDPFDYRSARLLHPFLSYAVDNWSYHASFYDVADDDFFQSITSFVDPHSLPFLRWLAIKWGATSIEKGSTDGIPTPLHLASFAGLSEFALKLLRRNTSVSALDAQERTPLHWAAANGHAKVASLLMRHGANPDADDRRGLRPIHLAALRDRVEVIKLLLKAGVNLDTGKTKGGPGYRCGAKYTREESALSYASRAGSVDTVLALASFCDENMLGEMLCLLCSWNRTEATLALLDNSPVSPNATYRNATALYYACSAPNSKCAERLISRGADVNKVSRMYKASQVSYEIEMAPIHRLVEQWNDSNNAECQNILEVLLKAGADIDQLNGEGQTALLQAASYSKGPYSRSGHCFPSVKALVEVGANVKAVNPPLSHCVITRDPELCSSSVLHSVARKSRDLEIMKLLLERGYDLNEKSAKGQTVLLCAIDPTMRNQRVESERKTRAIVEYLLDQGANPSCQDDDGNSPISYAMSLGASIFRLLFSKCQDMVEKKRCWFSLSKLRRRDTDKFSQCLGMFLSEGFDIETRDEDGKTLFLHCCVRGPRERMEILLSHGANPNAKTSEGHNALLLSCLSPSKDCEGLRQLIAAGVSPLETNNDGNTVIHLIAECHNMKQELAEFVCHLIDSGVPVNATNNNGSTPLHLHQEKDCRYYDRDNRKRHHFIDVLNSNHGVDFGVLDNNGLSAFHIAATKSEAEVAKFIGCGVDINLRTSDSRNALHLACEARKPNITGQLLMRGIDFDQQDDFGKTPLHYACRSGDSESVGWLLRYGASPYLKASDGSTVLHACADAVCEEGVWDTRGRRRPGLSTPPSKRLQPGRSFPHPHIPRPWYRRKSNSPPPKAVKSHFPPAIPGIVESLIQAGVEVGCCDENGTTALEVALFTGCTGFIEVFYRSESLLEEATKNLETIDHGSESVDTLRQRIRLQISLMLPRPYLEFLHAGDPTLEMLLESPGISLGLLSTSDTIVLINKSFGKIQHRGKCIRYLTN
jgi:ankyrin repeat protein